jgi:serine/threonine protein kinase
MIGNLPNNLKSMFEKNKIFRGEKMPDIKNPVRLPNRYKGKIEGEALELLLAMLEMDPDRRITAREALSHPYFRENRAKEQSQTNHENREVIPRCDLQSSVAGRDPLEDSQRKQPNANKIRIKTISEPPSEGLRMNYSKTQDISMKLMEDNLSKDAKSGGNKTYYNLYENNPIYGVVKNVKPVLAKPSHPSYSKASFLEEEANRAK